MSVGVSRLDRDHKVMIGLINRVADAGEGEDATGTIAGALDALVKYTIHHFSREEHVMKACRYPEIEAHQEEHRLLRQEVQQLHDRFQDDPSSVGRDRMLSFLQGWLNHHILLQDFAYRPFAEACSTAEEVAEAYGEFDLGEAWTIAVD